MGAVREVSEAVEIGPDHIIKVLTSGDPGGATLWVGNLVVDVSDAEKNRGGTRGFPATFDEDEGSKGGVQDFGKVGGRQGDPGGRDQTSLGVH